MATAKIIEIICCSSKGFDDAIQSGIAEASETLRGLKSAWVKDQSVCIENNKIVKYKVILKLTFKIEDR
jgi:flavin-binding protein dodecin